MLASFGNLAIVAFSKGRFVLLNKILGVYHGVISEVVLKGDLILPLARDSKENLKAIKCNTDSYSEMVAKEDMVEQGHRYDSTNLKE